MDKIEEPHSAQPVLAQIILGGQDGLVNVLGLILGLAVASNEQRIVLAGGVAAVLAESISMAAVAFTSKKAEQEMYKAELKREKQEINKVPDLEKAEVAAIYRKKGFGGRLLGKITRHITSNKRIWLSTMMSEELHLAPISMRDVYKESMVVGISTVMGSVIPLVPFLFLPVKTAIVFSVVISALALLFVGMYKGEKTSGKPLRSGVELTIIGLGAALAGYIVGLIFKT